MDEAMGVPMAEKIKLPNARLLHITLEETQQIFPDDFIGRGGGYTRTDKIPHSLREIIDVRVESFDPKQSELIELTDLVLSRLVSGFQTSEQNGRFLFTPTNNPLQRQILENFSQADSDYSQALTDAVLQIFAQYAHAYPNLRHVFSKFMISSAGSIGTTMAIDMARMKAIHPTQATETNPHSDKLFVNFQSIDDVGKIDAIAACAGKKTGLAILSQSNFAVKKLTQDNIQIQASRQPGLKARIDNQIRIMTQGV